MFCWIGKVRDDGKEGVREGDANGVCVVCLFLTTYYYLDGTLMPARSCLPKRSSSCGCNLRVGDSRLNDFFFFSLLGLGIPTYGVERKI